MSTQIEKTSNLQQLFPAASCTKGCGCTSIFRATPAVIALAACITAFVCALVYKRYYFAIPFGAGTTASLYTLGLSIDYGKLKGLDQQVIRLNEENNNLSEEVSRLESENTKFEQHTRDLENSTVQLKNLYDQNQTQVYENQSSFNDRLERLSDMLKRLGAHHQQQKKSHEAFIAILNTQLKEKERMEDVVENLNQKIEEHKEVIGSQKEMSTALQNFLNSLSSLELSKNIGRLEATALGLVANVEEKQQELMALKTQTAKLQEISSQLLGIVPDLSESLNELNVLSDTQEKQINQLREILTTLPSDES